MLKTRPSKKSWKTQKKNPLVKRSTQDVEERLGEEMGERKFDDRVAV